MKQPKTGEDISEKVKVTGSVDSSTPGFYNLVYSVANVDGFSVTKTRQVMVVNPDSFASAYQGESQAGTRHYTGAPILLQKMKMELTLLMIYWEACSFME